LRSDHPLTAPAYSERRSTLAKSLGLGRKPKAEVPPAVMPTAAPTPLDVGSQAMPTRRPRSRSASRSADVTSEAVAEPKPARKRRSCSRVASPQPEQTLSLSDRRDLTAKSGGGWISPWGPWTPETLLNCLPLPRPVAEPRENKFN
jgi:hypothetical protein